MSGARRRRTSKPREDDSSSSSGIQTTPKPKKSFTEVAPDQPVHVAQDSLFSSSSGWTNYQGFFNLAILLLVVSNGRVALENLIKYGILINPLDWVGWAPLTPWHWPNIAIMLGTNISIILSLLVEKFMAVGYGGYRFSVVFYTILMISHFVIPAIISTKIDSNPLYNCWTLTLVVIEGLKLVSYAQVNYWCRTAYREGKIKQQDNPHNYPNNLTISNVYYFMAAPTLCYELRFPRTPMQRKRFLVKRVVEFITFSFIIVALCQQWVMPLVKNSIGPFSEMDFKRCLERVLKLAIPNHLLWLLGFYTIFHSGLNLLAEILRFGDREFYLDFWNAETISYFWRTWNMPVHRWCVRHVFRPIVNNGYSKITAAIVVFLISAFFHEYIVSVPLHMFRLWAFNGMLAQIPLSILTDKFFKGGRSGNIIVWLSLILGQPMAILMYVHDWYLINHPGHTPVPINQTIPHI
ncbi:unnamed protein product [Bursaphelenchus okinawaensis]|uniref:O-acyltransferase n=1 Tax=Bursaphelenchus okinawaensis TaxID=465554 RepID=A0A811L2W9_9BILA|nr:unnamed protein product [Bursaphelenchus okinawaensis]CAG9117886.1 unnamed protein product [Bursaphelenchus okinawaensis]